MKALILIFFILSTYSSDLFAQCNFETQTNSCKEHLSGSGGKYLKTFKVDMKNSKGKPHVEFSYIFSKGTYYYMSLCSDDGMYVNLYDKSHKLIATSYDVRTKKHYPAMAFKCTSTGAYYFQYKFVNDKKDGCGTAVLGWGH